MPNDQPKTYEQVSNRLVAQMNFLDAIPREKLVILIIAISLLGVFVNISELDLLISRTIASGQDGFPLRGDWVAERLLHYYGGKLTLLSALIIVGFNLIQVFKPSTNLEYGVVGRYILISWLVSFAVVGGLKQVTTLPCPWDLTEFGGDSDYLTIFKVFSSSYPAGHCFPAGHATGAYGLICLGFAALTLNRSMKLTLIPVFLLGILYGGAQILRGAHFLSHDLFSIAISLLVAWVTAETYLFPSVKKLRDHKQQLADFSSVAKG